MRFAVFTHVEHQYREGIYFAYAPYVREMNIWFGILNSGFKIQNSEFEVDVVAPLEQDQILSGGHAYGYTDIKLTRIPSLNLLSSGAVFSAIFKIPLISFRIIRAMHRADHLHLRCPGNIGLLACVLQIFFPGKRKTAKYAGNWDPEAKQPWSYNFQKWILQNTFLTRNMTVLVYGEWPKQSNNVKSFFTASFSEKVILKTQEKSFAKPNIFLFVGNLVAGKGLKMALKTIRRLQERGVDCKLEIYGEGPERISMEAYVESAGIQGIEFKGNRSLADLELGYQEAHFLILPSKSEGWPKAVAEGMFFGCIPVVTDVSCVRWMLGDEKRGVIINNTGSHGGSTQETEENVERIMEVLGDKERMQRMSDAAREWSQKYTLEKFEAGIKEVLGY